MASPDHPADDSARWAAARASADRLSETGIDPLDVQAAAAARTALVRRFVLDAVMIFAIVAVVALVVLIFLRAARGDDPLDGREIWLASAGLVLLVAVVALRAFLPARAAAYEKQWAAFVEATWPGSAKGDELGTARLAFVQQVTNGAAGSFPLLAPGRKA